MGVFIFAIASFGSFPIAVAMTLNRPTQAIALAPNEKSLFTTLIAQQAGSIGYCGAFGGLIRIEGVRPSFGWNRRERERLGRHEAEVLTGFALQVSVFEMLFERLRGERASRRTLHQFRAAEE
jgi:hypothetical protein